MIFTVEKRDLSAITSQVARAASNKNTIPVLSGLLIQADREKGLTMTATDMEIGVRATSSRADVVQEGQVLVNAHYFADFIKVLPDTQIKIELEHAKAKLKISYGRSSGYLNIYREQEYPELPLQKMEYKLSLPQKVIREALKKTSFASAQSHFRQVFTGILFDFLPDNNLKVVASDTHRLAYYNYHWDGPPVDPEHFIVPTRTVNELLRWLEESEDSVNIGISQNNVVFYRDDFLLLSRLIEGQYPNYEQVIPTSSSTEIKLQTSVMANILERAKVMPTDDKLKIPNVLIFINENEALIKSYSEMMGEIEEVIEDLNIEGEKDFKISFNTNYFLDIVKLLVGECSTFSLSLSGSLGPVLVKNPDQDNYIYVLVPLRTSS